MRGLKTITPKHDKTTHIAQRRQESFWSIAKQYKAAVFVFKLSDTQSPSSLVTNDALAWSLNGARAFSISVWVFLVNENEEEEVEVG